MLDRLVSILPASQQDKAKAWVVWLGTVAGLLTLVIPDSPSWLTAAIAVLTALGVYQAPNRGYVRPTAEQRIAPFVGEFTPKGQKTPGGLAIWGIVLAIAGIVEAWGVANPGSFDTLSEFTRWVFNTDGESAAGPIIFGVGWTAFAAWFLVHILGGKAKRNASPSAPATLLGGIRDDSLNDVESSRGAVLHVRCPIDGCTETIDSVIETETWGSSIPGDFGCGNVTLHGSAMWDHYKAAHTYEDLTRTLVRYYEQTATNYTAGAANLRERHPELFDPASADPLEGGNGDEDYRPAPS